MVKPTDTGKRQYETVLVNGNTLEFAGGPRGTEYRDRRAQSRNRSP